MSYMRTRLDCGPAIDNLSNLPQTLQEGSFASLRRCLRLSRLCVPNGDDRSSEKPPLHYRRSWYLTQFRLKSTVSLDLRYSNLDRCVNRSVSFQYLRSFSILRWNYLIIIYIFYLFTFCEIQYDKLLHNNGISFEMIKSTFMLFIQHNFV